MGIKIIVKNVYLFYCVIRKGMHNSLLGVGVGDPLHGNELSNHIHHVFFPKPSPIDRSQCLHLYLHIALFVKTCFGYDM